MSLRRRSTRSSGRHSVLGGDHNSREPLHRSSLTISTAVPSESYWGIHGKRSGTSSAKWWRSVSEAFSSSATWSPATYKAIFIAGILLAVAPWLYHSNVDWRARSLLASLESIQEEIETMAAEIQAQHAVLTDKEKEAALLEEENTRLYQQLKDRGDDIAYLETSEDRDAYFESEAIEEAYLKRIDGIETAIKKKARQNIVSKYGVEPPRVNITVHENSMLAGQERRKISWFVIETAPTSLVPQAVDHFLSMVDLRVWDGLTLLFSTMTSDDEEDMKGILQHPKLIYTSELSAAISSSDSSSGTAAATILMDKTGSPSQYYQHAAKGHPTQLAFSEQSSAYPIEKYSVVFSGRPGGPNFYINMQDGWDKEDDKPNESCFGKVVQGQDVLDRMVATSSDGNGDTVSSMVRMMTIQSVRVIKD